MLERIGQITVDAGLCWVGDPCYVIQEKPPTPLTSWEAFCEAVDGGENRGVTNFEHSSAVEGLGVCVSTGYGDGIYDVFVRRTPKGRIAELRVVFIGEGEEDE